MSVSMSCPRPCLTRACEKHVSRNRSGVLPAYHGFGVVLWVVGDVGDSGV